MHVKRDGPIIPCACAYSQPVGHVNDENASSGVPVHHAHAHAWHPMSGLVFLSGSIKLWLSSHRR